MESTIHRFVCSAGIAILLAGCAYDGMYTRFLIPRIAVTEDQAAVSDIMCDVLKPFGFSQMRSPAPGRFTYAGTDQRTRNVTVVLDTAGSMDPRNPRVDLGILVLDSSGSEAAKYLSYSLGLAADHLIDNSIPLPIGMSVVCISGNDTTALLYFRTSSRHWAGSMMLSAAMIPSSDSFG